MSSRRALDVIQVNNPCPADWDQMVGDNERRFCTHCQKFVHDLSAMPADEAEKLVCGAAGSLCVRFARDVRTQQVITLDYRPMPKSSRRRAIVTLASILSAMFFAGTWAAHKVLRKPLPPVQMQVMGDMVCPPPPVMPSR